jgi:hypothetical protein
VTEGILHWHFSVAKVDRDGMFEIVRVEVGNVNWGK